MHYKHILGAQSYNRSHKDTIENEPLILRNEAKITFVLSSIVRWMTCLDKCQRDSVLLESINTYSVL